jgi:uncharacterized protein YeaO (DUF488 family)
MIAVKRIYDERTPRDGYRVSVDRLWPRGVKKENARLDEWLKEVAPSGEPRKRFKHEAGRWDDFKRRYFEELTAKEEAVAGLVDKIKRGKVTLLYAARDTEPNNAVALKEYLEAKAK